MCFAHQMVLVARKKLMIVLTLTFVWGRSNFSPTSPSPCWFSLNNSETVKAVALAFCGIQSNFVRDVHVKFGVPYFPQ